MAKRAARLSAYGILIAAFVLMNVQTVFAGGWFQITASDTVGSGVWNDSDTVGNGGKTSPHGGFSSSSNLCKTCHAVHAAGDSSFRLLKDGTTGEGRSQGEGSISGKGNAHASECMYCHDADSGASSLRPYELGETSDTVRGEHTLDATTVPDSDINGGAGDHGKLPNRDPGGQGAVLGCYQCHSVHGAKTINGLSYDSSDAFENWNLKILRLDPGGDGTDLAKGFGGMTAVDWEAQLQADPSAVRTGFCADCHNQNPNWATSTVDNDRPNKRSHVQGPGVDALLQVSGVTMTVAAHPLQQMGCRGCHYATDRTKGSSRFPHQSTGWKLLYDEATMSGGTTDVAGNPDRAIPKMDSVCLSCHAVFSDLDDGTSEEADCFACHDSKYNAPDVGDEIRKASNMGTVETSNTHREGESDPADFGAGKRHAECDDCHNAKKILPWKDGPFAGSWGINPTNGAAGAVPTYAMETSVTSEIQICFKCHSAWTSVPDSNYYETTQSVALPQGDKSVEFNPNNNAFHPVEAPGRNVSSNLNAQLLGGLTTSSKIKCTDCHNSDETSGTAGPVSNSQFRPKGPHGSDYAPVLRAKYYTDIAGPTIYDRDNFALCFICHDPVKLVEAPDAPSGAFTNFQDPFENLHWFHLTQATITGVTCRNCHYNIHSNTQALNTQYVYGWGTNPSNWTVSNQPPQGVKTHMVNFSPDLTKAGSVPYVSAQIDKPVWRIDTSNRSRRCYVQCHAGGPYSGVMSGYPYRPDSGDDTTGY